MQAQNMPKPRNQIPKMVGYGLDVVVELDPPSALFISHYLADNKLEHFHCDRNKIMPLKAKDPGSDGQYRSSHMRLFKLVTGNWPNAGSYQTWFGWSKMNNETQLYSCALNTPGGWHGAGDRALKHDVRDIFREECFHRLLEAFWAEVRKNQHQTRNEKLAVAWGKKREDLEWNWHVLTRHGKGGSKEDAVMIMKLKKCGKRHIKFDPNEDLAWSYKRCCLFECAEDGPAQNLQALFDKIDEGIDMGDTLRKTAFTHAAEKGNIECMDVLMNRLGANPNHRDRSGWFPSLYAGKRGDVKTVQWLFNPENRGRGDHKTNINQGDYEQMTVAMNAAKDGNVEILQVCIDAGANLHAEDKKRGATALNFAQENGHGACVKVLQSAGARASDERRMQRHVQRDQEMKQEMEQGRGIRRH